MTDDSPWILRADDDRAAYRFEHPLNELSDIHLRPLSRLAGMQRLGVSHARVPPGKDSFIYHSHQGEEEFIYILSGNGRAVIDGAEYDVGPGDFLGFSTPSVAHNLRNTGTHDLVYLTGGENHDLEVADFPELGKRMYRYGAGVDIVDHDDIADWPSR